jgi:hypothetical protein
MLKESLFHSGVWGAIRFTKQAQSRKVFQLKGIKAVII